MSNYDPDAEIKRLNRELVLVALGCVTVVATLIIIALLLPDNFRNRCEASGGQVESSSQTGVNVSNGQPVVTTTRFCLKDGKVTDIE